MMYLSWFSVLIMTKTAPLVCASDQSCHGSPASFEISQRAMNSIDIQEQKSSLPDLDQSTLNSSLKRQEEKRLVVMPTSSNLYTWNKEL
jgi:hypothetical protein